MGLFGGSDAPEMWDSQKKELARLWGNTKDFYNKYSGNQGYTGPFYSGMTGDQTSGMDMVRNFANGQAGAINGNLANTAQAASQWGQNYGQNANDIYSRYSVDPTQTIAQNAGAFINNDVLNGQIDAANRDVTRALTEGYMPQSARSANMSGNANSSRHFVDDAIATRGAQDRMADTAAQIRGNAYNTALGQASSNYFNGANAALAGNAQVGNSLGQGIDAANASLGYNGAVAQGLMGIGQAQQTDANAQIAADKEQATYLENLGWNRLAQKSAIINGSPSVMQSGGSGFNPLQAALGVGLVGAGVYTGNPTLFGAGVAGTTGGTANTSTIGGGGMSSGLTQAGLYSLFGGR